MLASLKMKDEAWRKYAAVELGRICEHIGRPQDGKDLASMLLDGSGEGFFEKLGKDHEIVVDIARGCL